MVDNQDSALQQHEDTISGVNVEQARALVNHVLETLERELVRFEGQRRYSRERIDMARDLFFDRLLKQAYGRKNALLTYAETLRGLTAESIAARTLIAAVRSDVRHAQNDREALRLASDWMEHP